MKMIKKITAYMLSVCVMISCVVGFSVNTYAEEWGEYSYEDGYYHISTAQQLVALSEATAITGHPALGGHFVLDNDITIPPAYDNQINIASDSGNPFFGIFDGNGHTIKGLSHSSFAPDSGLFGFTDKAVIKNLTLDMADVQTINRGGLIVGHAEGTEFLNISIQNSHIKIISGGVAIELITADGATIGGIAGEAIEGCLMYNCETVDTVIDSGEAEGVSALGGDGYFVGGLVGTLDNSHIEYSRTISKTSSDSGKIEVDFVVAVSALNFKNIYLGGIVGEMKNGASVRDSYSNVYLASWPATGVTVIGAVYGYLGGIAGITWGEKCTVERCHYSGTAKQRDFGGAVVVAPVNNSHRSGIIGCINEAERQYHPTKFDYIVTNIGGNFKNLYYNRDVVAADGDEAGLAYMYLSAGRYWAIPDSAFTECSALSNEQYANRNLWIENDFDFGGSTLRDTPCNALFEDNSNGGKHVNQWVMDVENNMPVHGITTVDINSNISNAFAETPVSMEYQYTINADDTITMPDEAALTAIKPGLDNSGYIGIALVSEKDNNGEKVYSCDYMYEAGANVDIDIVEDYIYDTDKKIYGVWCQAYTLGAQIGLNNDNSNKGLRALTAVNTDLLENIGLTAVDEDYGRGATFIADGSEYIIEADSKEWRGESYIENGSYNGNNISGYVANARVFSIFLGLEDDQLNKEIGYNGDILYDGVDESGKAIVFDYVCNEMKTSAENIAKAYIADLEEKGGSADNYYGIGQEAYESLMSYVG